MFVCDVVSFKSFLAILKTVISNHCLLENVLISNKVATLHHCGHPTDLADRDSLKEGNGVEKRDTLLNSVLHNMFVRLLKVLLRDVCQVGVNCTADRGRTMALPKHCLLTKRIIVR